MFQTGYYIEKINEKLSILNYEIEGVSSLGLYNINKHAEEFIKTILNRVLGLQLENLNELTTNYPGLDLGDKNQCIAFQITSTKTSKKVDDTLATCIKFKSYEMFKSINIFILGSKQQSYSLTVDTTPYFQFDSNTNILDFSDLQRKIETCAGPTIKAIFDFIDYELPYFENRLALHRHPIFNIPYGRNQFFTGRTETLKAIANGFQGGNNSAVKQAISGLGGIGKSQIALEYAYLAEQKYSAVFWVVADTDATMQSGYLRIAQLLKLVGFETEESVIVALVKTWLQANDNWLLILDNADEPGLIESYLPVKTRGHILLTSRTNNFDLLGEVRMIELENLSEVEAVQFLLKRAGYTLKIEEHQACCAEIARELGYLPLALEQAGAFIKENEISFKRYLEELKQNSLKILELQNPLPGNYRTTVARTWSINFAVIDENYPGSASLLRYSAFVSPDNIPFELIEDGYYLLSITAQAFIDQTTGPFALERNLSSLTKYSLIKRQTSTRSYAIHRLVQEAIKQSIGQQDQRYWAKTVCQSLNHVFPDASFNTWPLCEKLWSHALLANNYIDSYNLHFKDCGNFLDGLACYLRMRGDFIRSEQIHLKSLFIRERDCGPESIELTEALNNLSLVYTDQLQFPNALPLLKRALKINEQIHPADSPELSLPNNNLGMLYVRGRCAEKGVSYLEKALHLERSSVNQSKPFIALILNNLAEANMQIGQDKTALEFCEEGLEMREQIGNPEKTYRSYAVMASIFLQQKKYPKAELFLTKGIKVAEGVYGTTHPELLRLLYTQHALMTELGRDIKQKEIKDRIASIKTTFNLHPVYLEGDVD